jgi:endonuclease I/methionine-rich copper-binding protein CopC
MMLRRLFLLALALASGEALADANWHRLADGPLAQGWSNTGALTTADDWTGVPAFEGYLSGDVLPTTANDPRSVLDFASAVRRLTPDIANLAGYNSAGVIEAELADPVIALQATNAADVPFLLLHLDTTNCSAVQLGYRLRDLDTDTATQPYVVQWRLGTTGNFTELAGSYVANANTGTDLPFALTLPVAAEGQSQVQLRWLTVNVAGNDAIIGIDDIAVSGTCTGGVDNPPTVTATSPVAGATQVAPTANLGVNFSEAVTTAAGWFALACSSSGSVALVETGSGNTRTLDPVPTLAFGETCTASIDASRVTDLDGTADPMAANVTFGFTVQADVAPTLSSSTPASGASNVPLAANLSLVFSEPVTTSGAWYALSCATSGPVTATASGGPTTFTLDPVANLPTLEVCTLTLTAALIVDQDGNADPLAGSSTISFTTGASSTDYYASVDASSANALRATLHALIDDHTAYRYTDNTAGATDVWDILEAADEDPADPTKVLDVYRNRKYTKVVDRSGATGPNNYNREHTWPNSLGFNDLSGVDAQNRPYSPYTDAHMLYASASDYNASRGNSPYGDCATGCTEFTTDLNNGTGGGSGVYPGNSNWGTGGGGLGGTFEVWARRKGDVARAILYMDVRYEGGTAANGQPEPDLIITDNRSLITTTPSGQVAATGYMGLRTTLLAWHFADPPDAREQLRNEVVFSYQGNRNPFIDHPEYAACLWQDTCTVVPPDAVFANGFEP